MIPPASNSLRLRRLSLTRSHRKHFTRAAFAALVSALSLPLVTSHAATLTWDPGTPQVPLTGTYNSGTWDNTTTNWSNGTTDQAFVTGSTANFGGVQTTTATVTLGAAISALNIQFSTGGYTITPSATNTLTLTGGFGTTATPNPGTGATIYNGAGTNTINGPLIIGATGSTSTAFLSAAAGTTLNLTSTITQTTPATSNETVSGGGTVNYTGTGFATGKFNVAGAGTVFNASGTMSGFTGTYTGVADAGGATWNVNGGTINGTAATLFVGNGGGTIGNFTVSGGGTASFAALNAGNNFNAGAADSTGTVTVGGATGGLLNVTGAVRLGSNGAGVGTLNLNANGRIVIGSAAGTIARGTGVSGATGGSGNLNFNGGVLQYNAAPNTPAIAANITTTILDGGATINSNGFAVTVASPILHGGTAAIDGGLIKFNAGILTLTAANTYTGPTTISGGTLLINANGGLSSSNVTLAAGVTLSLATGVTAAHSVTTSTLTLTSATTSTVNLAGPAGTVQDTVGNLIIAGVVQAPGTYGATGSGAQFTSADFTGTGFLLVAIPEPSTYATMLVALGGLAVYARQRQTRRQA